MKKRQARTDEVRTGQTQTGEGEGPDGEGRCDVYCVDEARVQRALAQMPPDHVVQDVADAFKVLAHPTRVRILRALAHEELCVCDLSAVVGLSVSAVSHQLRAMRAARLVRFRTEGKLAYYCVCDEFVRALVEGGVRHAAGETSIEAPSDGGPAARA